MTDATNPKQINGPAGRFYEVDGDLHPSVTHVLQCIAKPALVGWSAKEERKIVVEAASMLYADETVAGDLSRATFVALLAGAVGRTRGHQRQLRKAAEIGTGAHLLIEWHVRKQLDEPVGPEPTVADESLWAFMAWQDWAAEVKLEPILCEQIVYSRQYGYAGTMDLLANVRGVPTLLDWKTGKAVYAESFLQNVAYQHALVEMGHAAADVGAIVRLPKNIGDPVFEVVEVPDDFDGLFATFLATLKLWRWWYANEEDARKRFERRRSGAA